MTEVEALSQKLGLPAAPLVLEGLGTTVRFFHGVLRQDPLQWIDYLRGIDFHQRVTDTRLPKGRKLIRYESLGNRRLKPFSYFTDPGASPFRLGTSFPTYEYRVYETDRITPALASTASGISFGLRDRVSRGGGGVQYIIAFSDLPALFRVGDGRS